MRVLMLLALIWGAVALAQEPEVGDKSDQAFLRASAATAAQALPTFKALVEAAGNAREMGFESPAEVARATLGEPLLAFFVRLDELDAYRVGQNPEALLHSKKRALYPLLVGPAVKSSLTVAARVRGLEATAFGGSNLMRAVATVRASSMSTTGLPASQYFLVEIPAMKLVFTGHRVDRVLMLTPVVDYPAFDLKAGVSISADKLFIVVQPATKSYRDAPG